MLGTVHACYLCFPFFVGLTAGIYAFQAGTGPFGAIVVGFVAGGSALVLGRYAFSVARGPVVRLLVELLFVVPAARAGYDVTLALSHIGIPSEWWRESFAMLGAIAVGSTAWARVSMLSEPALRPGRCARPSPAADWGDDHGQVTLRVYRLSVGISADIRSSNMTATSRSSLTRRLSRVISSADYDPVCRCVRVVFCRSPFCTPGFLFLRLECGASCLSRSLAGTSPKCSSAHAST